MLDVLFVAVMAALFAVTALFVKVCDRIIGADEEVAADAPANAAQAARPGKVAA